MKRSIYTKFIFIYIVAAILSFAFVAIGTSRLVTTHMTEKKAGSLYTEATLLSNDYAADYYRSRTASSLETVYSHLDVLATYLDADIWMIDLDGKVILEDGVKVTNIAVKDGKIIEIGDNISEGNEIIDAEGLALAPGFIDSHSHSDSTIFADPHRVHVLRMGVTTEIAGQCGGSRSPAMDSMTDQTREFLASKHSPYLPSMAQQLKAM